MTLSFEFIRLVWMLFDYSRLLYKRAILMIRNIQIFQNYRFNIRLFSIKRNGSNVRKTEKSVYFLCSHYCQRSIPKSSIQRVKKKKKRNSKSSEKVYRNLDFKNPTNWNPAQPYEWFCSFSKVFGVVNV